MAAIWCNGGPAVMHNVGPEDPWPVQLEAVDMVKHLDPRSDSPTHASDDNFPYCSPSVRNLLREVEHNFVALDDHPALARSLSSLLSHCVTLRAVMDQNTLETELPYPLTSFVVCALRQVFRMCFPEAETLEYVECALPRTGVEDVDGVLDVTSTTMIAALVVVRSMALRTMDHENVLDASPIPAARNSFPKFPGESDSPCIDLGGFGRSSFTASKPNDVRIAEEDGPPSAANEGYAASECTPDAAFDGAAEFHVISHNDLSSSCAVVLFCAEVGDRIYGLMASMLHQRRALGIYGPVMGLQIAKFSARVKILVGWMEDSEDCTLPQIHIAVPIDSISEKPSSASFDLSDPREMMCLAACLLSLRVYAEADVTNPPGSPLLHTAQYSWRADAINAGSSTRFNPEAIEVWARAVLDSFEPPSPSRLSLDEIAHSPIPPTPLSSERGEEPPRRSDRQETFRKYETSSGASQTSHARFTKSKNKMMCWLICRGAFLYSIPLHPSATAVEPNVYDYRQLTRFARISELSTTKYNQIVPELLRELSDQLFDLAKMREDAESTWPVHRLSMLADRNAADSAMGEMKDKPDLFIRALSLAQGCRSRERIGNARVECEFRHDWDALLFGMLMYDETSPAPTLASLEQTLNRPANLAFVNNVPATYNRKDFEAFASHHATTIFSESIKMNELLDSAAPDSHYREVRQKQEVAAAFEAGEAAGYLMSKNRLGKFTPLLLREALTAKCDAFGMIVLPLSGDFNSLPFNFDLTASRSTSAPERYSMDTPRVANNTKSADVLAPMYDLQHVCPWMTSASEPVTTAKSARRARSTVLRVPALVIEYKKEQNAIEFDPQGVNQTRLYLVSALRWLEELGVTDFPVYGMTTDGSRGAIMYGILVTTAKNDEGTAVLPHIEFRERDARCYDLTSVLDTIDFALFLRRLVHDHIPKLKSVVEEALKKRSSDSFFTWGHWTRASLKDKYHERPTVPDLAVSQGSQATQTNTPTPKEVGTDN